MFWYHTPELLHRLNPLLPGECWRCGSLPGSLPHIFWDCLLIKPFWSQISNMLVGVFSQRIPLDPANFMFNMRPNGLSNMAFKLLVHILTAAKCLIAAFWKQRIPPTLTDLHTRMGEIKRVERITASLHNNLEVFDKVCIPLTSL